MSATMRAAVLTGPRRFALAEIPRPAPGPGEVRVRLEGSGVCGSNLVPWQGREWFRYPFAPGAPGHEGWGVVDAVGEGVRGAAEGDRVALLSTAAFAEYDVAPAAAVVPLPPGLTGPFPGEALGCGVNVFRRSRVAAGEAVAVVGAGFLGLAAVRLAVLAGADVVALSRRETARAAALRLGAAQVLEAGPGAADRARALAPGGFDVVIEAVGSQAALDLATALPREGGRLVIAGFHQDGLRAVDLCAWNWKGLDVVNAHERDPAVQRAGVEEAARLAAAGRLDLTGLYRGFPLAGVGEAFHALEARPEGFVKGLVLA